MQRLIVSSGIVAITVICMYFLWNILVATQEGLVSSKSAAMVAGAQKLLDAAPRRQTMTPSPKTYATAAAASAVKPEKQVILDLKSSDGSSSKWSGYKRGDVTGSEMISGKLSSGRPLFFSSVYNQTPNTTTLGQIWANDIN